MYRREFLKWLSLTPFLLSPSRLLAEPRRPDGQRILVLIELNGGNDGLNTVIPLGDDAYYRARPTLAIGPNDAIELGQDLGFHPALTGLEEAWGSGDLATILGVGYPNPDRSHFRSIEIWEMATASDVFSDTGWVAQTLNENGGRPPELLTEGLVFGDAALGPLLGTNALVLQETEAFEQALRSLDRAPRVSGPAALQHVLDVHNEVFDAGGAVLEYYGMAPTLPVSFGENPLGRQLDAVARLIAAELPVAVLKVTHTGFDTHANQRNAHNNLLRTLGDGLATLRTCLLDLGRWDDTVIATYSEFGRRAGENASGGTDHGTSAPHFVLGGAVQGGFYGQQPLVSDLVEDDLRFEVDFRSVYATIVNRWWGLECEALSGLPMLDFLA